MKELMKHTLPLLLLLAMARMLTGCGELEHLQAHEQPISNQGKAVRVSLSESEAVEYATQFLSHVSEGKDGRTRMGDNPDLKVAVSAMLNGAETRSVAELPDTLAYVINFGEDEGFAIVSAVGGVYPIIGYSDTGHFEEFPEGEGPDIAGYISSYLTLNSGGDINPGGSDEICIETIVEPFIKTKLSQRSPYDKYVIEEYPGCPVGCGAVAAANAMLYGADAIIYHGDVFFCKSIREAIANNHTDDGRVIPHGEVSPQTVTGDDPVPYYTKAFAQNEVAKMMYYIGPDIEMKYSQSMSTCNANKVYLLIEGHNAYEASTGGSFTGNRNKVYELLDGGYMIMVLGPKVGSSDAHIWNIDGYQLVYGKADGESILSYYLHCDYGWGGESNGYYNADMFKEVPPYINPFMFWGVKRK